jgi:hypothetical protein
MLLYSKTNSLQVLLKLKILTPFADTSQTITRLLVQLSSLLGPSCGSCQQGALLMMKMRLIETVFSPFNHNSRIRALNHARTRCFIFIPSPKKSI